MTCDIGAKVESKLDIASSSINLALFVACITGSNTIGHLAVPRAFAAAFIAELLWIIPTLTAVGGISRIIDEIWRDTKSASSGVTFLISRVFCAVIAVITVQA
jgi:hypothetical protein